MEKNEKKAGRGLTAHMTCANISSSDISRHDISETDISRRDREGRMQMEENIRKKYCPMTETTFYTLLALLEPNHGYGIMKFVRELTGERVKMGTGTLYTMLGRLVTDEMIVEVGNGEDKRVYQITQEGRSLLYEEQKRLKKQWENGERILGEEG